MSAHAAGDVQHSPLDGGSLGPESALDLDPAGHTAARSGVGRGSAADLDYATHYADGPRPAVQLKASGAGAAVPGDMHAAARRGIEGPSAALPFADVIQRAFGPSHDVSAIQAHVGGQSAAASAEMGAQAFAVGDHVAFAGAPDLHTAAHEAAHVVQQAQGVNLYGGVGEAGDLYERHADTVADRVVAGASAADLLGAPAPIGGGGGGGGSVQLKPTVAETKKKGGDEASSKLFSEDLTLVARDVYAGAGKLDKGVDDVIALRDEIAADEDTIKREAKKIKELQATDDAGSHSDAIGKHINAKVIAKNDRDALQTNLDVALDKWRTTITQALKPAQQRLGLIVGQVGAFGLDPQEIATGATYVRNTLARFQELCGRMGLQVDALDQMAQQVDLIFKQMKIVPDRVNVHDLERMGDDKTVAAENLSIALDAVQAQVDYAKVAGNDLVHPVGLLMGHMEEAVNLISHVDPAERKKLKGRVTKVVQEVKAVHKLAASHQINDKTLEPLAANLEAQAAK